MEELQVLSLKNGPSFNGRKGDEVQAFKRRMLGYAADHHYADAVVLALMLSWYIERTRPHKSREILRAVRDLFGNGNDRRNCHELTADSAMQLKTIWRSLQSCCIQPDRYYLLQEKLRSLVQRGNISTYRAEYARAIQELKEETRIQATVGFNRTIYTEKELGWLFLEGMDDRLRNEIAQQGLKEYQTMELMYSQILTLELGNFTFECRRRETLFDTVSDVLMR